MQKSTDNALTPLTTSAHELIPCRAACPINLDVAAATLLVGAGKKVDAQRKLMENNPLPLTLSHLCHAPCASACKQAVSCKSPFVRDFFVAAAPEASHDETPRVRGHLFPDTPEINATTKKHKIAIVGSSPAALSAAYFTAQVGMAPTVFDSRQNTGGWLLNSVSAMSLPDDSLRKDLARLRKSGVGFALLEENDRERMVAEYRARGFDAVLLVPNYFDQQRHAALTGDASDGIFDLGAFVRTIVQPDRCLLNGVTIIGGGTEALAAGLLAAQHGSADVTVVLYETDRHRCGVSSDNIANVRRQGVEVVFADCCALEIHSHGGLARFSVSGGGLDRSLFKNMIVVDASFRPAWDAAHDAVSFAFSHHAPTAIDAEAMITEKPGVFCAEPEIPANRSLLGDIAQGRKAADALCHYLADDSLSSLLPESTMPVAENADGIPCAKCIEHLAIRRNACSGCLECVDACPSGALYAVDEDGLLLRHPWPMGQDAPKARPMIDSHLCTKCGECTHACPQGALEMRVCGKTTPKKSVERKTAAQAISPVATKPSRATAV